MANFIPAIAGVSNGFGDSGYTGNNYLSTFNSWGTNSSPDVPQVAAGDGLTQLVNPAAYVNPNPNMVADAAGGFSLGDMVPDFLKNTPWLNQYDPKGNMVQQGVAMPALQGLTSLGSLFMGMKNYGLAKDQLNFQKQAFDLNYAAKKSTTNASLADRQAARVASNPGAYQSVGDYMNQYGIK